MSDGTKIQWCDSTWPVVAGCTRVSPACNNCYAIRDSWRMGHNPNPRIRSAYEGTVEPGPVGSLADRSLDWSGTVRCLPERLDWPAKWRKPRKIFVCNMSDLFHENVPDQFIAAVFARMSQAKQHTFQVLTKRPERMLDLLTDPIGLSFAAMDYLKFGQLNWTWPLPNVWLGVTAENQEMADHRIPLLLQVPAAVRFVSVEPMLSTVDLRPWIWKADTIVHDEPNWDGDIVEQRDALSWVIVGGESGPKARPAHPDWFRTVRDDCQAARVPFFFKQWGEWGEAWGEASRILRSDGSCYPGTHEDPAVWRDRKAVAIHRFGKKRMGDLLDGVAWKAFPEVHP